MITKDEASKLIGDSISSLVRSGTLTESFPVNEKTILLGSGSNLDSLGFITFVTDLEDRLEKKLGEECYLVLDEISQFNINNPLLTVDILAQYIVKMAENIRGGA